MSRLENRHSLTAICALVAAVTLALTVAACREGTGESTSAPPLPALSAALAGTTVSGISAGGYMAGQVHLAHSSVVTGAGIVAAGPYGCAESIHADQIWGPGTAFLNLGKAMNGCMRDALRFWDIPDPALLAERARNLAAKGRIDSLDTAARARIFLFIGSEDRVVEPTIVASASDFYRLLGVDGGALRHVAHVPAAHAFVTHDTGSACGVSTSPYIVDCDYDLAGEILQHVLGEVSLAAPDAVAPPATTAGPGSVRPEPFDQTVFTLDLPEHGLDDVGFVFVPASCRERAGCRMHVVFHGCGQARAQVGDRFAVETGYLRWADANRLIVLFPQVAPASLNPHACWDWWGYTGRAYMTREGFQVTAVKRMLDQLAASLPRS